MDYSKMFTPSPIHLKIIDENALVPLLPISSVARMENIRPASEKCGFDSSVEPIFSRVFIRTKNSYLIINLQKILIHFFINFIAIYTEHRKYQGVRKCK